MSIQWLNHRGQRTVRLLCVLGFLIVLGSLGLAFGVWLLTHLDKSKPRALANTVTFRFLDYTNNASGIRTARFKVTNPSSMAIDLNPWHELQVATTNGWASQGLQPTAPVFIGPNQSAVLEFAATSAKKRWRMWLNYTDHVGSAARCLLQLKRLGLPVSVRVQAYSADSGPIDP